MTTDYDKAPVRDIKIPRGKTLREVWKLKDTDTGEYVDLSTLVIVMQIRESVDSKSKLKELAVGNGFQLVQENKGLSIDWNVNIKPGKWVYDIRATYPDSFVNYLVKGKFEVIDVVTE